jgi:hypothetical protein
MNELEKQYINEGDESIMIQDFALMKIAQIKS